MTTTGSTPIATLTLPREVPSGNAMAYRHWRQRMRDRQAWELLVRVAMRAQPSPAPIGPRAVRITAYRKRRITDADNLSAGCKHLRDALTRCGLLIDDSDKLSRFEYRQELASRTENKRPQTVVEIWEGVR